MKSPLEVHIIAINAKGLIQKSAGLIGKKKAVPLFFSTRFGIHSFGVNFPIDVLVMDEHYKVVKMKSPLKRNAFFFWNPRYKYILELPYGTISRLKIKPGSLIKLKLV